jgi:prophage maintenance system killer protein
LFRALNDRDLQVPVDEAVRQMLAVASGEVDEAQMATWPTGWIGQPG